MGFTAACIYDLNFGIQDHRSTQGDGLRLEAKIAIIVVGPMLVTNAISTLLIAWKAWYVVWLFVSVLVHSHDEYRPRPPGITTKRWVHISGRVGLLGAWRKSSSF